MADDPEIFSNMMLNIISVILSAALPVMLLYFFKNRERQEDAKEKDRREATEKTARDLRETNERVARELEKENIYRNEKLATDLKNNTAAIANDLKAATDLKNIEMLERMNTVTRTVEDIGTRVIEVRNHVDDITRKQADMGKSMEVMIQNLHQKADMTNGNVASIRNDLLNLQEDIDEMNDRVNGNDTGSVAERRIKKRKRDARRNEIAKNSAEQHHHFAN